MFQDIAQKKNQAGHMHILNPWDYSLGKANNRE